MTTEAGFETAVLGSDIDVWLAFYDEINDAALLDRLRACLSRDERDRQMRYHFASDRKRDLVTRALVRTVLSRYAAVAPKDWTFVTNRYGRPEIADAHAGAADLRFNVSHTHGLIALAVTRHCALGVDVEHLGVRTVSAGLAQRLFAPHEAAALARLPPALRTATFFEYWTFKEAYAKARGMGLSIPFEQFAFDFPSCRTVRLTMRPELGDDARRWAFWQFRPTPEYVVAVCAERLADGTASHVRLHRIVPTVADEAWPLPVLKSTEPIAAREFARPNAA